MSDSDKPARTKYSEWLRQKGWPFAKRDRAREGCDSVLPHLEEFVEQSKLLSQRQEDKGQKPNPERDKPRH